MQASFVPACGALVRPIELAANKAAYFVGKVTTGTYDRHMSGSNVNSHTLFAFAPRQPNPIMMRNALRVLSVPREEAVIIGDRMDTDILGGKYMTALLIHQEQHARPSLLALRCVA